MKAIAYQKSLPATDADSLVDIELPLPAVAGRDLLVEVRAVSVNPVDTKVRRLMPPANGEYKVLGYDAAGIVTAVGPDVTLFRPGDAVFYAGSISRPGTNSEFHVVDERLVGRKPASLDFASAAALPLTSLTAWELLFDRLQISTDKNVQGQSLLIIGAGGGVGSAMIQLARQLTAFTVIATASRPETQEWVRKLGAHHVIDHTQPLAAQLRQAGFAEVTHVVSLTHTHVYFEQIVDVLAPQGRFGLIDDPEPIDLRLLKRKSQSLHLESMFTRSVFQTADMQRQHDILDSVADLVDAGTLTSTLSESLGKISAANLRRAHALIESGKSRGKIVLEGF